MAKRLKSLNERHLAAARMKVEGRKVRDIAAELGTTDHQVHVWFSDPLVKTEIARLAEAVESTFVERMASSGLRALDELLAFSEKNAARSQAHCLTCNWFGDKPEPHGNPSRPCVGPWRVVEYIGEGTKMDALRSILDRLPQTATNSDRARMVEAQNGGGANGMQLTQVFANMPDAELAEFIKEWQTASLNGDSPAHPPPAIEATRPDA